MTNIYTEIPSDTHERVVYCENVDLGLKAFIAVHNTQRGPALGGCRMWEYDTKEEALTDVLRLSAGMTNKSAIAGLNLGGGKAVIWGNSKYQKTPGLLKAMGDFVDYLGGIYIIAEDVGISCEDVAIMRERTEFTANPASGDPGPVTADGVFIGIKALCDWFLILDGDLTDVTVAVQGVGSVGFALVEHLLAANANVIVADMNQDAVDAAVALGATSVSLDDIYSVECNVFAPCALGAIINDDTIPLLRCEIIAGSANNQLLDESHGQKLHDAGILYAPDYVINAGGVIMIAGETDDGYDHTIVDKMVNNIGPTLVNIVQQSHITKTPTNVVADKMAEDILKN